MTKTNKQYIPNKLHLKRMNESLKPTQILEPSSGSPVFQCTIFSVIILHLKLSILFHWLCTWLHRKLKSFYQKSFVHKWTEHYTKPQGRWGGWYYLTMGGGYSGIIHLSHPKAGLRTLLLGGSTTLVHWMSSISLSLLHAVSVGMHFWSQRHKLR